MKFIFPSFTFENRKPSAKVVYEFDILGGLPIYEVNFLTAHEAQSILRKKRTAQTTELAN